MRVEISTREISDIYNIQHKDIMRQVKRLLLSDMEYSHLFEMGEFKNARGRVYKQYTMNLDGFSLLSEFRSLSGVKKAIILDSFGSDVVVVGSKRTRSEDIFYKMLCEFLPHINVVRQFPVCGYRVDFYLEGLGLFVEYDEEQHFSKSHAKKDEDRWSDIFNHISDRDGATPNLIRISKGSEIYGLSLIMSYLALNSMNAAEATVIAESNNYKRGAILIGATDTHNQDRSYAETVTFARLEKHSEN